MKQEVVQSVDRSLTILEALGTGKKTLLEITNTVDLNKSTVHRLLQTLIYKSYVFQNEDGLYALTPKLLQLGQQIIEDMDIIAVAKPFLEQLNEATGEIVHLVMIENNDAIYIDKIEAKHNVRMYSYVGKKIPLFSSAVGKAYLAFSDLDHLPIQLSDVLSQAERFTEFTLVTETDLKHDLEKIKARGYSIDQEENELGVICVAAPIYDYKGQIKYAVSVSTPKFRLTDNKLDEYGNHVANTTLEISRKMGYTK